MQRLFQDTIAPSGLQASLVVNHQRVSHRERVALALAHGGGVGQIQIAGVWASVCGGVPSDQDLPVFAEPMPPGPDQGRWRRIYVEIDADAKVATSEIVGWTGVDWRASSGVEGEFCPPGRRLLRLTGLFCGTMKQCSKVQEL